MPSRLMTLAACLALLACAPSAPAQQTQPAGLKDITVTGAGSTVDDAVRDALRKAVEQGAGVFIHSQSKMKDFAIIKDTTLTRAQGFVTAYKVLTKAQTADGVWEVRVKATVSLLRVQTFWGEVKALLDQVGRPKIMVFINEKIGAATVPDSTVQARIERQLLQSGFLLVNKRQIKAIDQKDLAAAVAEDKPAKIQAIAKRYGAQIYISGTANATSGGQNVIGGVRFHAYEAEANVKCYRSDTAQLLSSVPGRPVRGVDRVWRSAAKKALDGEARVVAAQVRLDILRFWVDALGGHGEVQLHVEGCTFKQYVDLKKALKQIKGVEDVTAKYHNKIAECSIRSSLNAETLGEKIVEAIKGLEITDVSQNVIKAKRSK